MKEKNYYIYMLRCADNSIYTGITTDLSRRVQEHKEEKEKCAKYTLRHHMVSLEAGWKTDNRSNASKLEYHLKHLSKIQKESLIQKEISLKDLLETKLIIENYKRIV